jgi:hypothetical protein
VAINRIERALNERHEDSGRQTQELQNQIAVAAQEVQTTAKPPSENVEVRLMNRGWLSKIWRFGFPDPAIHGWMDLDFLTARWVKPSCKE